MPDANQLDARVRQQTAWLTKVNMIALCVLFFATLGSLIYGFRILHEIQEIRATSPERMDAAVNIIMDEVNCGRQEDLEASVRALIQEINGDPSNVVIEWGDSCPEGAS